MLSEARLRRDLEHRNVPEPKNSRLRNMGYWTERSDRSKSHLHTANHDQETPTLSFLYSCLSDPIECKLFASCSSSGVARRGREDAASQSRTQPEDVVIGRDLTYLSIAQSRLGSWIGEVAQATRICARQNGRFLVRGISRRRWKSAGARHIAVHKELHKATTRAQHNLSAVE
jgi:hypothetical protein